MSGLDEALQRAGTHSGFRVVALPDFFLDHFIPLASKATFDSDIGGIHARGGGNVVGAKQHFASGGNAANTCLALARLGVDASLITRTDALGARQLHETLGAAGVDLSGVRSDGELAVTTALEFREPDGSNRNVMLSSSGSVATFGPRDILEADVARIEAADAVLIANWSQTREHGTSLIHHVARLAHAAGALTYVDTGDPARRDVADIAGLLEAVASEDVDVFAMNENELIQFVNALEPSQKPSHPQGTRDAEAHIARGAALHARVGGTLDLHCAAFSASWSADGHSRVPTQRVTCLRATGAGDAWNAGNLLGYLLELEVGERLTLANTVAGLYISNPSAQHPSLGEVRAFLRANPPSDTTLRA